MKIDLERVKNWFDKEENKTTKFSDTHLLYSSIILPTNDLSSATLDRERTCFGDVLDDIDFYLLNDKTKDKKISLVTTYEIPITRYGQEPRSSRFGTWMTKEELYDHMNQLSDIGDLNSVYDIKIEEEGNKLKTTITFDNHRLSGLAEAKMILFWMRYAFEYPYNLIIVDAYLMKEMEEYKNESMIRLALLANSLIPFNNANLPTEFTNPQLNRLREYLRSNWSLTDAFHETCSGTRCVDIEQINREAYSFRQSGLVTYHYGEGPQYLSNGKNFLENERRFEYYAKMRSKYLG